MADLIGIALTVPSQSPTSRPRAWRPLKACGAAVLRDGVYVLPSSSDAEAALQAIADELGQGGTAELLLLHPPTRTRHNASAPCSTARRSLPSCSVSCVRGSGPPTRCPCRRGTCANCAGSSSRRGRSTSSPANPRRKPGALWRKPSPASPRCRPRTSRALRGDGSPPCHAKPARAGPGHPGTAPHRPPGLRLADPPPHRPQRPLPLAGTTRRLSADGAAGLGAVSADAGVRRGEKYLERSETAFLLTAAAGLPGPRRLSFCH